MANKSKNRGNWIWGVFFILVGAWLLLETLGLNPPGLEQFWPAVPALGGLAFILAYLFGGERADPGLLIPGVGGLLTGLFFFMITLGPLAWRDLAVWWPVFPLIGGIAFLMTWLAGRGRDWGLLVPAGGGIGVGVVGLLVTLDRLDSAWVASWWPVGLIVLGLLLMIGSLGRRTD